MGASKTKENKGHNTILNMNHSNATFKPFILGVYIIPGVYIVPGVYIIPAGKLQQFCCNKTTGYNNT